MRDRLPGHDLFRMTGATNMTDIIHAGEQLAGHNDRFAFFVALAVLATFGICVMRYLTNQNALLVSEVARSHDTYRVELARAHETYRAELKELTNSVRTVVDSNTKHLGENTEVLELVKAALRARQTQRD